MTLPMEPPFSTQIACRLACKAIQEPDIHHSFTCAAKLLANIAENDGHTGDWHPVSSAGGGRLRQCRCAFRPLGGHLSSATGAAAACCTCLPSRSMSSCNL